MARKIFFSFHFDNDYWRTQRERSMNPILKKLKNLFKLILFSTMMEDKGDEQIGGQESTVV